MYCNIALPDIPSEQLYTYKIPEKFKDLVFRGQRVYVNLKNQTDPVIGYVISLSETSNYPDESIKPIHDIVDSLPVPEELIELAYKISEKYLTSIGGALDLVFPAALSYSSSGVEQFYDFNRKLNVFEVIKNEKLSKIERLILQYLYNSGAATMREICSNLLMDMPVAKNNVKKLEAAKILSVSFSKTSFTHVDASLMTYDLDEANGKGIIFTEEQQNAIRTITQKITKTEYSEQLIFGVTGSGKTEVYIEIIKAAIAAGKSAIVLVPEIALTEHLKHRYLKVFPDCLAVWHSLVTKAEKAKIYSRIASGGLSVLLGARSAIFAPFENLGCIIIDEEHDTSYKQDNAIRYDAREVSRMRMRLKNGVLVLGSATPALDTYYPLAKNKNEINDRIIVMSKRVENRPLPKCHIVDMAKEFTVGKNKSMFSEILTEKINDRLDKKQQTILFLNRRGHSTFVLCRACGHTIKCDECSVSMTYHSEPPKLLCHYCNKEKAVPSTCPKCQSPYIRFFGVGTEKVEEEFRRKFPEAKVARLDSDILTNKTITAKIFDDFLKKRIDVLIGTQIIAKGLDFHNITLVGIISADTALNMPDMFASERTFQVLCQVIGRTGRGQDEGECVIQTYNPDNYAITSAAVSDYNEFYRNEIEVRESLFYPPASAMIKIGFWHEQETLIQETAQLFYNELESFLKSIKSISRILGPAPALISKVQNIYRYNIFILTNQEDKIRIKISELLKKYSFTNKKQCVKIFADINPNNTY